MSNVVSFGADFIGFLFECLLWYIFFSLVFKAVDLYQQYFSSSLTHEERTEIVQRVSKLIHTIKKEQHGEVSYWFDEETDQFLGQGRTEDEIRMHLLTIFKGHIFILDEKRALAGPGLETISIENLRLTSDGRSIN